MRLRQRTEYAWSGSKWNTNSTVRYVYDGNVVVQEQDQNNTADVSYTRGRDLSGTLQGAGGIGGLLARSANTTGAHAYYFADGNGNVTCMTDTNQSVVASYLYDPYGRILSQSGWLAAANLYRFSSKEFHVSSGLVCYLYRFYDPNLQRWINRDPINEIGFSTFSRAGWGSGRGERNLFAFLWNDPGNRQDALGLDQDYGTDLDDCLQNCKNARQRGLAKGSHVGRTIVTHVICDSLIIGGAAAFVGTPAKGAGLVAAIGGVLGLIVEGTYTAAQEAQTDREVKAAFKQCCTGCGKHWGDPDAAQNYYQGFYPD
jgi:RHS repeat-associated protein